MTTFVCTCTKTSSGLQVGAYTIQLEDLEDIFVLKRTSKRRKKKPPPPPPSTGIFCYLASLVAGPHKKEETKPSEDMKELLKVDILVIFVFGEPRSGKGTQCMKVVKYNFMHILFGDLLPEEVQASSDRGKEINEILKRGQLVPLDVVLQLHKTKYVLAN
ncbi:adenylate kinase isoenzyme, putative [Ixodes scapularis]|uniref:Adenylate kinase isoenzyme, putative n=1 Tax=Ixodes scapularis TaxID=6945 RepID=B7P459_IXOSC|nr:adenylate kinase isoenzyme, putative [Ixodes scapularis]|eukprot:XP_002405329.1 adenylate kinase isoenzyme, putative [Ixodes scapularis]